MELLQPALDDVLRMWPASGATTATGMPGKIKVTGDWRAMAKHRYSRRGFMGLSGAGIAGLVGAGWPGAVAAAAVDSAQDPDLVVFNAKVYTVDPLTPRAEAFAVKAGRFVAVGSTEDVKMLIGKRTQTFDAKQMTVVPGFIDAHNHAPGGILLYEVVVGNPYEVEFVTIASIVDKLRAKARETPAGFWVEGYFFDDTKVRPPDLRRV
jgi:Amidohydrolase family